MNSYKSRCRGSSKPKISRINGCVHIDLVSSESEGEDAVEYELGKPAKREADLFDSDASPSKKPKFNEQPIPPKVTLRVVGPSPQVQAVPKLSLGKRDKSGATAAVPLDRMKVDTPEPARPLAANTAALAAVEKQMVHDDNINAMEAGDVVEPEPDLILPEVAPVEAQPSSEASNSTGTTALVDVISNSGIHAESAAAPVAVVAMVPALSSDFVSFAPDWNNKQQQSAWIRAIANSFTWKKLKKVVAVGSSVAVLGAAGVYVHEHPEMMINGVAQAHHAWNTIAVPYAQSAMEYATPQFNAAIEAVAPMMHAAKQTVEPFVGTMAEVMSEKAAELAAFARPWLHAAAL